MAVALVGAVLGVVLPRAIADDDDDDSSPKITEIKDSEYYPLKLGTKWTYLVNGQKVTVAVAEYEKVGGTVCARLETSVNGTVSATEHVGIKDDGVCRSRYNGSKIDPPLCFLKLPPKDGTKWKVKSKQGTATIKGDFEEGEEKVEVAAGEYKTFTSKSECEVVAGETTITMTITYYFAKGVGMVKQEVESNGATTTLELKKFTPGKDAKKDDEKKDEKKDEPKKEEPKKDEPKKDEKKDY